MRLRNIFRRKTVDREMVDEMELHLERATERLIARGLSPGDARLAARREFGNVGVLQEEGRDARGARWIESVAGDIRFALRHFAHKPLATATIILVLSIGIGAHAAVFSIMQAVTTRPAPGVPRDDALVFIRGKQRPDRQIGWRQRTFSYPELRDFANQRDVFASVAGWTQHSIALDAGDGDGTLAHGQFVTSGFFSTIGIRPILGAGLPLDDQPQAREPQLVAVIGHTLWTTAFASSPDVLGKMVRVNDIAVRIVGVAPPRFNGAVPTIGSRTIWMPLSARAAIMRTTASALASRDSTVLTIVGRLRAGATIVQANAAARVIDARFAEPPTPGVIRATDVMLLRGDLTINAAKENAIMALVFEAMALLILLITCTNVSALVVGAGVARRHEIAIRLSLGASRARVVRQLLTESSLLAVAGGGLGLLLYWWIAKLLAVQLPRQDITPDLLTVALTMCFAVGTGLLFGLSPALHATGRDTAGALKDSAAGITARSRLQRGMVIAQIALTQPLLVGLGVTMVIVFQDAQRGTKAEIANQTISLVFDLFGRIQIVDGAPDPRLSSSSQARVARTHAAMQRVAALPGVAGVIENAGSHEATLSVASEDRSVPAQSAKPQAVSMAPTDPGYFALLEIPIVRGRDLVASDTATRDIPLVIGSDLAHELWGSEDALGRRLDERIDAKGARRQYTVVGVYDSRRGMEAAGQHFVYVPMNRGRTGGYLIRTIGPATSMVSSLRSIIREEIPQIPIVRLETVAERDEADRIEALRLSGTAGGGGVLALLLASIGLYGVVALALGQRRREIGVRIALGARPQQVVGMLFSSGVRLSLIGLAIGLPLSVIAMKVAAAEMELPDVNIAVVGGAIGLVVIAVAAVASWLPARRAAGVDPMIALRSA